MSNKLNPGDYFVECLYCGEIKDYYHSYYTEPSCLKCGEKVNLKLIPKKVMRIDTYKLNEEYLQKHKKRNST